MPLVNTILLSLWRPYSTPLWFSRRVYKQLLKRNIAPAFHYQKRFYGLLYEGNFDNHIDKDIFYFDAFEKPILYFMRDYIEAVKTSKLDTPFIFIDIGANIGQHTLFVSRLADHVHAFEPFARVSDRLEHQIQLNALTNITLHKLGIGQNNESLPFYAPTGTNLGIGSFSEQTQQKGNALLGNLQIVRGDDYFAQHNISSISLMKIDVEGLEKPALLGLRETLTTTRPLVLLEITYGEKLSITSMSELASLFPTDYQFFVFNKRKKNGKKSRRMEARNRSSGEYALIPYEFDTGLGQDDIVACPVEQQALLEKLL